MSELWGRLAELAQSTVESRLERFTDAVSKLAEPTSLDGAARELGAHVDRALIQSIEDAWKEHPDITGGMLAAGLLTGRRAATMVEAAQPRLDLVWTGPDATVAMRRTEPVMVEVIEQAKGRLFLVSYVNYGAKTVLDALNDAIRRGVTVSLLMQEELKDTKPAEKLKKAVPGAEIYVWKEGVSVHAKCVVADENLAFITSANLTTAALRRNMELGVRVEGGPIPQRLHEHLRMLITTNAVRRFS